MIAPIPKHLAKYDWYEPHQKWLRGEEGGVQTNLSHANLSGANFSYANLIRANLSYVDLSCANLSGTNLSGTNLSYVDLSGASLSGANLSGANLSGAKGLQSASHWLSKFVRTETGVTVYKRIGNTDYPAPNNWKIEPGAYLVEVANPTRTQCCGCGVNFGTRGWCERNYGGDADLWECEIEWLDLASVVVPYNTDGKARCERLRLVKKIEQQEDDTK